MPPELVGELKKLDVIVFYVLPAVSVSVSVSLVLFPPPHCFFSTPTVQLIDNMPKDLNRPWEDPMPDAGERLFTMELRGISVSG